VVLLLAGCAQKEAAPAGPPAQKTTIFRFTSAPSDCPKPETAKDMKRVTKSRDDWKRYAESLEKLLPSDAEHGPHP
jgi:hypothetical protein